MAEMLSLELSDRQREILLRGLRFVRRSRMLEFRDTTEITEDERVDELREIQQLNSLIEGNQPTKQRAAVG
jgi:hypothetical protein